MKTKNKELNLPLTQKNNASPDGSRGWRFIVCAMHGDKLDGGSPLWGFVITNH